jgi:hypothetical protein
LFVAEFRDTIYPGLVSTGKVERDGSKPFHTVINGENYHALKALTYTHRGKVDVIYIDPPYNTGAKDWKYNNDYGSQELLSRLSPRMRAQSIRPSSLGWIHQYFAESLFTCRVTIIMHNESTSGPCETLRCRRSSKSSWRAYAAPAT